MLNRTIAHPIFVPEFLPGLTGTAIAQWHRRGKYLIAELIQGSDNSPFFPCSCWLSWRTSPDDGATALGERLRASAKHTRVRLFFQGDRELRFVDQRTFGQLWWVPPNHPPEQIITGLQALGLNLSQLNFRWTISTSSFILASARSKMPCWINALLPDWAISTLMKHFF